MRPALRPACPSGSFAVLGREADASRVLCLAPPRPLQVFFNNLLSLPLIGLMMVGSGEWSGVWQEPDLHNPSFVIVVVLSGVIGFGISFTSLWFISTTTPTIYSLVGSLNKVPLAFIGLFAFNSPWSLQNMASIAVGLFAGVVFVVAKSKQ